jgi:hypothetical protein
MWSTSFWKQSAERSAKSAAQALIGLWALDGFNVLHAHWDLAFGVAVGAAVLSILTSIVSAPFGPGGTPSVVDTTPTGQIGD